MRCVNTRKETEKIPKLEGKFRGCVDGRKWPSFRFEKDMPKTSKLKKIQGNRAMMAAVIATSRCIRQSGIDSHPLQVPFSQRGKRGSALGCAVAEWTQKENYIQQGCTDLRTSWQRAWETQPATHNPPVVPARTIHDRPYPFLTSSGLSDQTR